MLILGCVAGDDQGTTETSAAGTSTGAVTSVAETATGATATSVAETSTGATATSEAETSTGTTTTGADSTTGGDDGGVVAACGLPEPCDEIVLQPFEDPTVPFDANMTCALQALSAGDAAFLHYYFNGMLSGEADWLDVAILGDGTAVREYSIEDPVGFEITYDPPERCTLRPQAWFDACLAGGLDDATYIECTDAYAWFEDDCVPATTCPP